MKFLGGIADSSADGNMVRLPPILFQPIAADDIAPIIAEVALAAPRNSIVEIAGPERAPFNEIVARYLKAVGRSCATPRPDTGAAVSRSDRSCRWAKRASATSVWTNGSGGNPAYYQARANGVNAADEGFKTDWRSRAR